MDHVNEARTSNFKFIIGQERKLSFSVQSANVGDVTLGQAMFPTRVKDIMLPSNKLEFEPLNIQFIVGEDHSEFIYMFKWLLKMKNRENSFVTDSKECELMTYDAQNQPSTRFVFSNTYPYLLSGMDYTIVGNSIVINCNATLWYNDFYLITKSGERIDYGWDGEL